MPTLLMGGVPLVRAGAEQLCGNHFQPRSIEAIQVASSAFENNSDIPLRYSADGQNISPPLKWGDLPKGTQSVVLIAEDPDAPTPKPFVHWLAYNIPPEQLQMAEGISGSTTAFLEGKNSNLKQGWAGMAPPKGDTPHHYHFQLFALDAILQLEENAGRGALVAAMEDHVLAKGSMVGLFRR